MRPPVRTVPLEQSAARLVSTLMRRAPGALWCAAKTSYQTSYRIAPKTTIVATVFIASHTTYQLARLLMGEDWMQGIRTQLLMKLVIPPAISPRLLRCNFNDLPLAEVKPVRNHTHGEAAADRSGATNFIDLLASTLGRQAYFIQCSASDRRSNRQGSRTYYWTKDLNVEPSQMAIPEHALVAMVDVDQYIDMPGFLCDNFNPVIIYTFQPEHVSKRETNYCYTFNSRDEVNYMVTGGAVYNHMVWNYSRDHMFVVKTFFGVPYKTAAYLIDRRRTSADHEMIFLTPQGKWRGPAAIMAARWLKGRPLERLQVATPAGYLRLQVLSKEGLMTCTGRADTFASAKINASDDDALAAVSRTSSHPLTMPLATSFVPDGNRVAAVALVEYHRLQTGFKAPVICPVEEGVRRYQFDPFNYDPGAKPGMKAFMQPLVHDAFVPDQTKGNEVKAIVGRVEKVKPKLLPLNKFLQSVMLEFAAKLIPEEKRNTLDPTDYDEVLDRQPRPTQRMLLAFAEAMLPDRLIKSFVKKEPYAKVADPRMISTLNTVDKREYSRYMYAFQNVLKEQPWYAFGQTPRKISERVVAVLADAKMAVNTDFSRFDGHGSNLMRELEKIVLMRAFRHCHHGQLLELHRAQYSLRAVATWGTWYETEYSRASGSPETAVFNSLVNAFVAFLALRMSKREGLFNDVHAAYAQLGIYGGDDGLTADIDKAIYIKAAATIGQELTVEPIMRGCLGIKFLARVYSPQVWFGDLNTCCDVVRQISKLHVTVTMPPTITPRMKFLEKMRSYALSDEHSPIIGGLVQRVIEIEGKIEVCENKAYLALMGGMRSWLANYDKKDQYPNEGADWMIDYCALALPDFEYKRFQQWLVDCKSVEDLLKAPMFQAPTPPKSVDPVMVDGQLVPPNAPVKQLPVRAKLPKKQKAPPGPKKAKGERKQNIDGATPKEKYEHAKERKQRDGTWVDRPKKKGQLTKPPQGAPKGAAPQALGTPARPRDKMKYVAKAKKGE